MITIVDYGMGNLNSILNMLNKCGTAAEISGDPERVAGAEKLILPGVGAFDAGMNNLAARGLLPALITAARERKVPLLGICLGMQLMTRGSEEGQQPGLGWLAADTVRFRFQEGQKRLKVPHMGWNTVRLAYAHKIFAGAGPETRYYFVHSFHVCCDDPGLALAYCDHGGEFVAAVADGNLTGVQFHPEKSHRFGLQLLRNFAELG